MNRSQYFRIPLLLTLLLTLCIHNQSFAEMPPPSQAMEEMLLFYDMEDLIVTATLHPQKVSEAPAIASVISGEEIRKMGARDIIDILNRIPGIHVTKGFYGKEEIEIRGIKTVNSEKIKLLIDGHSVNETLTGGAVWSFDSLTVDNVKRIEIIRGPGSALYGSNAFSAIVNVITNNGNDIDGILISAGGGSFSTSKANLQVGKKLEKLEFAFSLDYFSTDGDKLTIEKDRASYAVLPARVPGQTMDYEDKIDAGLKMTFGDFTFNSKYVTRERSAYLGNAYVLIDETKIDTTQYFGELSHIYQFGKDIIITKLYYDKLDWEAKWELWPEGSNIGTGVFPEGMIGVPGMQSKTRGIGLQIDHELFESNTVTLGGLLEKKESYDVSNLANFHPVSFVPDPTGNVTDVKSLGNWNEEKKRDILAVYFQDVWDISDDINLTLGVRYDDYSDFGDSTNPRAGIVWKFKERWDLKLLYGTAFRAPSFEELYNDNNNVADGNPDLKPEEMTTYEVSLGHAYNNKSHSRITYFNNHFKEKIDLVNAQFKNTGGAKIWGMEMEWKNSFSETYSAYLNYTYQNSEDDKTGERIADVASHKGNIGLNVVLTDHLNLNTNMFLSGNRPRATDDDRSSSDAYELVDLTLIAKELVDSFEIRCSIHNLLDQKYADPSPLFDAGGGVLLPTVPNDFPREGRNIFIEVLYKF